MTEREWKPGDHLPANGIKFWFNEVALQGMLAVLREHYPEAHYALLEEIREQVARPLIFIDPEDREQVERLESLYLRDEHSRCDDTTECMADALREFANPTPPKPDEPTGLGAVVEDAEGNLWVRTDRVAQWSPIRGIGGDRAIRRLWSEIAAVRVLSEGIQ